MRSKHKSFQTKNYKVLNRSLELDNDLIYLSNQWNDKSYELFKNLFALEGDVDSWKTFLDASTVPVSSLDSIKTKINFNESKNRINTILESIDYLSAQITKTELKYNSVTKKNEELNEKFLGRTFLSLLDTPSTYENGAILRYDSVNGRLVFVPFSNLSISSTTTFLGMIDTPVETQDQYIQRVEGTALVNEYKGYITRRTVETRAESFSLSELEGTQFLVILDAGEGSITVTADALTEESVVFHFVVLNGVATLSPVGANLNGDSSDVVLGTVSSWHYEINSNDYKFIGDNT